MKVTRKLGLASAIAAAALVVTVPAAYAAGTYVTVDGSPSPAGPVSVVGVNDGDLEFMSQIVQQGTECKTATVGGFVNRGTEVKAGAILGEITEVNFSQCTATDFQFDVEVEDNIAEEGTWKIVAEDGATAGQQVPIRIENVSAYMHSVNNPPWFCEVDAKGTVRGIFYPGVTAKGNDGRIEINTPALTNPADQFPLELFPYDGQGIKNPQDPGCALLYSWDPASMIGAFEMNHDENNPGDNPISHS